MSHLKDTPSKIYLDYNATTPMAPEVIEDINHSMVNLWGNPSSLYSDGVVAKKAIEEAREKVAATIKANPADIIFLSGGTEANNLAILSALKDWERKSKVVAEELINKKPHIISTHLEHDSVLLALKKLEREGMADVTFLNGKKIVENIYNNIRCTTCMVTVMLANNETGIILPIADISSLLCMVNRKREKEGLVRIVLHSDAAQAVGKIPVDVQDLCVDYLTIVGHKFYGPRIGALYVKDLEKVNLHPMFCGGKQERGYRPGTENTSQIVGLGSAAALVSRNLTQYNAHMTKVRDYLEEQLKQKFGTKVRINGTTPCIVEDPQKCSSLSTDTELSLPRLPNTSSISFSYPGVTGVDILANCKQLRASTGAACHSSEECTLPNSVLAASGVCTYHIIRTIRLSVGRDTTVEDIDAVVCDLRRAVEKVNLKT